MKPLNNCQNKSKIVDFPIGTDHMVSYLRFQSRLFQNIVADRSDHSMIYFKMFIKYHANNDQIMIKLLRTSLSLSKSLVLGGSQI